MTDAPSILYVEDDPHSRRVMQLLLSSKASVRHLTMFEESADFLQRVESIEPPPDVIFLDIHVKPHDGFEMLAMLRASTRFRHTPVIALTASVMNEEVVQLRTSGFDGCIAKPLNINQVPQLLDTILRREEVWNIVS